MQPTRRELEDMAMDMTAARAAGMDEEAVRASYYAKWAARDNADEGEEPISDRAIAEVLTQGAEEAETKGKALRALGIDISDDQAEQLINAAQLGEANVRDVVGRILSMPRIDPQEQDYHAAVNSIREARNGRAVREPQATSYTATITPME